MEKSKDQSVGNMIKRLKSLSNPEAIKGMTRYGISPEKNLGVSIPDLRQVARETGRNHQLAKKLWSIGIHKSAEKIG